MQKSVEKKIEIVNNILFGQAIMLMTKPIKYVKNKFIDGACTGYEVGLSNLSYRGIWISTMENVELTVDGQPIDKNRIYLKLNGTSYPVYTLESHTEIFWGIEDEAALVVKQVSGLSKGNHVVEISIKKRPDFGHSYGEGTEGYEDAAEFTHPEEIKDISEISI